MPEVLRAVPTSIRGLIGRVSSSKHKKATPSDAPDASGILSGEEKRRRYLQAMAFSFVAASLARTSASAKGLVVVGALSGRTDLRHA